MTRTTLLALAALSACSPAAAGPAIFGLAIAQDGDSLRIGDSEIRLFGIDAPEYNQTCQRDGKGWDCGKAAAEQLAKLVTGRELSCVRVDIDEHARFVSRCSLAGKDINKAMVESGYAIAYRHYSTDYVPAEEMAKAAKLGLWSGTFSSPGDYRAKQRESDPAPVRRSRARRTEVLSAGNGCMIKGNQGNNGWIYHLPGMPFYERTKAEQMFCSEAEAQAAGYRRAKVR